MTHADPTTEAAVLGALMDSPGPLIRRGTGEAIAAAGLTPDDFTAPEWRACFEAIQALVAGERTADPLAVWQAGRVVQAVAAKGYEALTTLQAGNALRDADLMAAAEGLRRLRLLRQLNGFMRRQVAAVGQSKADPERVARDLAAFADTFTSATAPDETGAADVLELVADWHETLAGTRLPLLPTGIEALDAEIGGWPCNLSVVGGLPSVGKSALIAEVIVNTLRAGVKVGVFGLEDATKWIAKRHLARAMGKPVRSIGVDRLHEHEQEHLQLEAGKLSDLLRHMHVYRRAGITPEALLARAKHWILNCGVKLVVIDHGGEVQHEAPGGRDRHDLAVAATYRALRDLAVNHRVPIVVLAHFNREAAKSGRPTSSSFAETAYIERMARLALGLWEREGDDRLLCTVLKQTEGERDQTVGLIRDRACALVRSWGGERINFKQEEAEREAQSPRKSAAGMWRQP